MPLDSISIYALRSELAALLEGTKIDKVQQPEKDALLLSMRAQGKNLRLLINVGTGTARVHFTKESMENPQEPPMFCMLLRKHLVGARIREITQPGNERMLVFALDTHDEMGVEGTKELVIELIGRSSNVILVGGDGRIMDCMRRMDFGGDVQRRMLPGMLYRQPPKQSKPDFLSLTKEERRALAGTADGEAPIERFLMNSFAGISPLLARELEARCGGNAGELPEAIDALSDRIAEKDFVPSMVSREKKPLDFSFLPIMQYGTAAEGESFESFSELLDAFYARRDREERARRRSHELMHSVKTVRDRTERKLCAQKTELLRTETREETRKKAELITANLYRLKKGDRSLCCEDYYEPDCPEITIPLDPLKTPQQNAAALFREYNKQKAAREHLTKLVCEGEAQLNYLNSVLTELSFCETEREVGELRRELYETGILKKQKQGKGEKFKPLAYLSFRTSDGFEVLAGHSNLQNDELTNRVARRTDYWFHTKRVHGSHVILRTQGEQPSEESIRECAEIAAYYSQGRSGKTEVDYTMVRNVRKPGGAMPGFVTYTGQRTVYASGDEELVLRLKQK